jgi:3-phosphoshikimate 1-carboxyvinyltransferase
MPNKIEIQPTGPVAGRIRPPGSKSITNRAFVCAALARGESTLIGALESEDTSVMIESLRRLGLTIDEGETIRVVGCGGQFPVQNAKLYVANSGTTVRFLTAMLTVGRGEFRLDGTARMRERPINDLLEALRQLGANVATELPTGCPPVVVRAQGLSGGRSAVAGNISSQFLSGLLMATPYAQNDVELITLGELVSRPYVDMTLAVMKSFGVEVMETKPGSFLIKPQAYQGCRYEIEPDASAASYFFAAAAITGGCVTVEGLSRSSLQGDVAFCDCLQRMGCDVQYGPSSITVVGGPLHGIEVDMNAISDTVQTLSVVALFADGPTTIHNVAHIRYKETNRLGATVTELQKLGAAVDERDDGLTIKPRTLRPAEIATYDDHRMAMSFALAGLATSGVVICDPECTSKTYPRFFEDLAGLCKAGK